MTVSLSKFQMIIGRMFCGGSLLALAFAVALAPAAAETVTIKIKSGPNRFEPKTATIKAGDTVMWMDEAGHHTATLTTTNRIHSRDHLRWTLRIPTPW